MFFCRSIDHKAGSQEPEKQEVETLRRKLQVSVNNNNNNFKVQMYFFEQLTLIFVIIFFSKDSFYEIDELKMLVKKLLNENCELKSRIDSSITAFDVPL